MRLVIVYYNPVRNFDFTNFDDLDYVTANLHFRHGVTPEGIVWALTSTDDANWFPLTGFFRMLDVQLFALQSSFRT